jgi:hypothetical protein
MNSQNKIEAVRTADHEEVPAARVPSLSNDSPYNDNVTQPDTDVNKDFHVAY